MKKTFEWRKEPGPRKRERKGRKRKTDEIRIKWNQRFVNKEERLKGMEENGEGGGNLKTKSARKVVTTHLCGWSDQEGLSPSVRSDSAHAVTVLGGEDMGSLALTLCWGALRAVQPLQKAGQ